MIIRHVCYFFDQENWQASQTGIKRGIGIFPINPETNVVSPDPIFVLHPPKEWGKNWSWSLCNHSLIQDKTGIEFTFTG